MIKFWGVMALLFAGAVTADSATGIKPAKQELMLANSYSSNHRLSDYWVSEKYDGYRAYWDGQVLLSRAGNPLAVPPWFIKNFPRQPLDGELWLGRGQFQMLSSLVKRGASEQWSDPTWHKVRFMVFDLPAEKTIFDQRLHTLEAVVKEAGVDWLEMVEQRKVDTEALLFEQLEQVTRAGGEGLMLHLGASYYRGKRSDDLLKLKQFEDAEAVVLAYVAGKGKYQGLMGALRVVLPDGTRFKIGSGFSDQERRQPPAIGSTITYRFNGKTDRGVPRFARFLRVYQPL